MFVMVSCRTLEKKNLEFQKVEQSREPVIIIITSQDNGPLASHRLATVHPFSVSPGGANQGEQLGYH